MTLSEIGKHNAELAEKIANNAGTLRALAGCMVDRDWELRQYACACLANIAKHNEELAQKVAGADIFTKLISCIKDEKANVQRQAVVCVKEIAKHSLDLAKVVCDMGGVIPFVVEYINNTKGLAKLNGIMTIGYVASFDHDLAKSMVHAKAHIALVNALKEDSDHIRSSAAWSLGQIGRHSSELARELADHKALNELLIVYMNADEKGDLKSKSRKALKMTVQQCMEMDALRPLLEVADERMLKCIVTQMAVVLKAKPETKRPFAERGALKRLLELEVPPESKLQAAINEIQDLYPPEIIQHYSPEYMNNLLKKIEEPPKEEQVKEEVAAEEPPK
eukprot:TRINITY_DN15743_c0_g1_i1.p1 TRINITY_DN15743_c0_g1~~TRINITY_DN15743_c0_g1_i1.p1  ORF type:complete len:335 (-),score=136.27 TRINITY_DN15743_c0_g1_i1:156-1160(-)